jgi:Na(+)-translocating NADH:ubiquinone oxidoreductase B subunit
MRLVRNLLDRVEPLFDSGGPFRLFRPVYDAGAAILLSPLDRSRTAPHVRDPLDVKRYMTLVIVALMPCLAASVYFFGLRVLAMVIVSYVAGGAVEVLFAVVRKEEINEGFLVTGLLFPLVLPPATPLWMVAVGVVFGVLVGKELFGGTGRNLFNPALVGRVFLVLAYPKTLADSWLYARPHAFGDVLPMDLDAISAATRSAVDVMTSATPLVAAKNGVFVSLWNLFFGTISGSAGETSAAAVLLGGLFLLLVGVSSWRTVFSTLGSFAIVTFALHGGSPYMTLWHMLAGGILLGAFFMATDPVSSPMTKAGRVAYGCIIGVSAALIRNLTGYVEGVMFSILLGNIFAPILDEVVLVFKMRRLREEG